MPSTYDDELWRLVPEDGGPPPARLVRFVASLGRVEKALDLGCGDGRLSREIRAAELTAADVSDVALARARSRLPDARVVPVAAERALPFADGEFELVLCAETIEHVHDVGLLVREAHRVLRAGGLFALTTPAHGRATALGVLARGFDSRFDPLSPHLRFFTRSSLADTLADAGFRVESLRRRRGTLFAKAVA